jgi:hypothetical protein
MRLFDYKFIILLGLILVVYFIYREVEYLRNQYEQLEKLVKNNKNIESVKFPVLALPKNNNTELESFNRYENRAPVNTASVNTASVNTASVNTASVNTASVNTAPVNPAPVNDKLVNAAPVNDKLVNAAPVNTAPVNTAPVNDKLVNAAPVNDELVNDELVNVELDDEDKNDSDTSTVDASESSKHLAVYSNENEQVETTHNSVVEENMDKVNFNYDKTDMADLKNTMDSIINSLSSETNNKPTVEPDTRFDDIINEKEKQLSEMSNSNNDSNNLSEKALNLKKIPELKKLAEKHNIVLTKKINGQHKNKNKNELIKEILFKIKNN